MSYKLTLEDIDFTIEALEEISSVEGNALASGDDEQDRKAEEYIYRQLEAGNEWAWCCVRVRGWYYGLSAEEYLGCCSYKSREDFENGGYFEDMRNAVLEDLQDQLDDLKKVICA